MADLVTKSTGHEETSKPPETGEQSEDYLKRILQELNQALSAAIAGDSTRPTSTTLVIPSDILRGLRDQLQSLRSEFWSALQTDGYHRGMIDTPTIASNVNTCSGILKHIKDVRDRKSAYGVVAGFCIPTVCEVFFEQAVPWGAMALEFVERCKHTTRNVVASVLARLAPTEVAIAIVQFVLEPLMDEILPEVQRKLVDLLSPSTHGYPLIYDPGFHDCIHHRRQMCLKNATMQRLDDYLRRGGQIYPGMRIIAPDSEERLVENLTTRTKDEADEYACAEMLSCAQGLYQNALSTFQKNVPVQCIEVGMLARLSMALSPDLIQHIDSEVLHALVFESPDARLERLGPKANQSKSVNIAQHQGNNEKLATSASSSPTLVGANQWPTQERAHEINQAEPKSMIPVNAMYIKEMKVLYFRDKLQLGFLTHSPPEEDGLDSLSFYLGGLETLPDLESNIVRATKVNIVLNKISQLKTIPHDQQYHFRDRSLKLLAKWNETLTKDGSGTSTTEDDSEKTGSSTPTPRESATFSFAPKPAPDIFANNSHSSTPPGTGLPAFDITSSQTFQPKASSNNLNGSPTASSGSFSTPLTSSDPPDATSPTSNPIRTPTPSSSAASTPPTQTISTPGPVSYSFPAPGWGHRETASTTANTPNTNEGVLPSFTFGIPPRSHSPFGDPSKAAHPGYSFGPLSKPTGSFLDTPEAKLVDYFLPSTPPVAPWPFTNQESDDPAQRAFGPSWSDCPGTGAHEVFCAFSENESFYGAIIHCHYQNVTVSGPLSRFSLEECRLADYNAGRRSGKLLDS